MKQQTLHPFSESIGDYIRKLRTDRGYSQYYMANAMNISQNSYCLIENGQTKITLERTIELSMVFNLTPVQFLSEYLIFDKIDRHSLL